MNPVTPEDLKKILEKHTLWVRGGFGCAPADFRRADLRGVDLREVNLQHANFRGADLRGVDLRKVDLRYAVFYATDLTGADLRDANLRFANLRRADLRGADLRGAHLQGARLIRADLRRADLRGADLRDAKLWGADLQDAKLQDVKLRAGELRGVKNIPNLHIIPAGDLTVYKKVSTGVATLTIPADAARSSATGRKCRASKAIVKSLPGGEEARSLYDPNFIYREGETVEPRETFDPDWARECGSGIHFFLTRKEAEVFIL